MTLLSMMAASGRYDDSDMTDLLRREAEDEADPDPSKRRKNKAPAGDLFAEAAERQKTISSPNCAEPAAHRAARDEGHYPHSGVVRNGGRCPKGSIQEDSFPQFRRLFDDRFEMTPAPSVFPLDFFSHFALRAQQLLAWHIFVALGSDGSLR